MKPLQKRLEWPGFEHVYFSVRHTNNSKQEAPSLTLARHSRYPIVLLYNYVSNNYTNRDLSVPTRGPFRLSAWDHLNENTKKTHTHTQSGKFKYQPCNKSPNRKLNYPHRVVRVVPGPENVHHMIRIPRFLTLPRQRTRAWWVSEFFFINFPRTNGALETRQTLVVGWGRIDEKFGLVLVWSFVLQSALDASRKASSKHDLQAG